MKKYLPFIFVAFSGLMRLLPHPSNFTPSNSSITYGTTSIKDLRFFIFPILIIFISDLLLSILDVSNPLFGNWMLYTYPVYLLNGILARLLIKDIKQYYRISAVVLMSSINFFFLTNLAYFFITYPCTFHYFLKTFSDAIPFFANELQANIMYSMIFFGYHYIIYRENDENLIEKSSINEIESRIYYN